MNKSDFECEHPELAGFSGKHSTHSRGKPAFVILFSARTEAIASSTVAPSLSRAASVNP